MKGNCSTVICQICKEEMSFGRIKRHIKTQHTNILVEEYVNKFWQTLPLHSFCIICNKNVVYKYQTCSKECHSILSSNKLKDKLKPEGFGIGKKFICKKENIKRPNAGGKGISRNKGKQPMLGKTQSEYQKQKVKERFNKYYKEGNEPWSKNNLHSVEIIEKIFKKRKINKLEKFVSYILDINNIEYIFQFFLKTKEGVCKSYDFYIKDKNILIELDGDYWHGGPGTNKYFYKLEEVKQNDLFKDEFALNNGYKLLRFWESDIYKQPNIIIDKLKTTI